MATHGACSVTPRTRLLSPKWPHIFFGIVARIRQMPLHARKDPQNLRPTFVGNLITLTIVFDNQFFWVKLLGYFLSNGVSIQYPRFLIETNYLISPVKMS